MPKLRYDEAAVRSALAAVVADHPQDHYDARSTAPVVGCRYMSAGKPQCLVAHVMVQLGVNPRVVARLDKEAEGGTPVRLRDSRDPILKRFTPEARALLARWQREQDRGRGWDKLR